MLLGVSNRREHFLFLIPIVIYLFCRQYARAHFWRDPTSRYFDPARAYLRGYSNTRTQEALSFLQQHDVSGTTFRRRLKEQAPYLCVGMNTIVRPSGDVYAHVALGSLVAGLSETERDILYLMPMIGHINASTHPIVSQPWLDNIADRVLTYQTSTPELMPPDKVAHIKELELERQRTGTPDREKHLTDYTHLLRECERTGAQYVLMLEDDVLLMDGWLHRTRAAIETINRRTGKRWFYFRLFHAEEGLGWQNEELMQYILGVCVAGGVVLFLYWAVVPRSAAARYGRLLPAFAAFTFVLFTYLFFSVGRISIWPPHEGVRQMEYAGCCHQGIVYPAAKIGPLTKWYEQNRIGFVDTLAERLADERPEGYEYIGTRWAISPVLLQHVGSKSSKGNNWDSDKPGKMSAAMSLWNFAFETYDADALRREHEAAKQRLEESG